MDEIAVALVINAGGQSRRMGRPKALLPLPPNDTPLIVEIMNRLITLVTDRIVVVANDPLVSEVLSKQANSVVMSDKWAVGGSLGGVATGLSACAGWAMVVACDMPLVEPAIFRKLIQIAHQRPGLDAVIPFVNEMGQPFHGLWHRRALQTLEARLARGKLGVQDTLRALDVEWVNETILGIEADDLAFYNINTPSDWEEFLTNWNDQKGR